jgi:hypothetical protein
LFGGPYATLMSGMRLSPGIAEDDQEERKNKKPGHARLQSMKFSHVS